MISFVLSSCIEIIVLSYKKFLLLVIKTNKILERLKGMVPSLTKGAFNEQENSCEDSDGSSCSKHGLSASTVKRYLKDHPEFLEKHIMQDVELEQLERWTIRRTQHSRKSSQSLGRNSRKTSLSRWKFCVHADKGKMLQDLTQSLQLQASKAQVLFELATCISSAVNADGFTLYIAESGDPENMSVYMGQSASGTNKMEKVKPVEGSYLLHVAKTKEAVRLSKGVPDNRFSDGIPKNSEIGHMLCQPIALPDGHLIAVVELFRCEGSLPFQEEDEEISLSYLVWSGIALQYAHLFMNMSKQRKLNDFLLTVLKSIFQEMVSLDMLVTKIMQFAKQLVDADRASLFLVDSKNQELYATIFDVDNDQGKSNGQHPDSDEIRFPIGTGIAGIVALKGETLNIQDVYSDARFNRSIDQKTGYKTETILCMPIFIRGSVIGVVQMVNKHSGCFTKEDEEAFEMFADYCGLALHLAQLHEELRLSEQKYKVALEVLSYHITSTEEELQKFLTATSSFIAPNNIDDFYFNPFAFDDMQKIGMAAHMFIDLFGLKRFDKTSLIKFTLTVKKNYRRVPYHNWSHGFCVANTAYSLIKSSSDVFGPIERLALFIGSLCHDLDHRGKNNKFMLETESPLACIYSTSTMEHHHFNHTITILQQEGHNIFVKLSSSQYKQVLGLIKHCILATDLELHFTNKTELQNLVEEEKFTWSNHEHRLLIQAIAMTASDLSAAAKPFEVQKETVKRIFQEFYEQGDAEREAGITPIPMNDRNQPDEQAKSQIGFLKGVCIPCYSLLYRLIPESKPLLDMCQKNFERWQKIVEEMKKKQEKQESSG